MALYVLPLVVAAAAVMFVIWRMHTKDIGALTRELDQARSLVDQRQHERDLAQDELFRRLYEERELNKEKMQFQAQLAEYEKYAALAQLALGAAHEINNPAARHPLAPRTGTEEADRARIDRSEIEQCIAGAKRISSTLRGLVNYARPAPLVLSKISLQRLVADTLAFPREPADVARQATGEPESRPTCPTFAPTPTSFRRS